MTADLESNFCRHNRLTQLIREAASKAIAEEDVWAKHEIHKIPAERIIRHMYHPESQQWSTDETIVKMQPQPFTHGAMRFCYRLKKMATPPKSASNHRFHAHGWTRASNYVAKCYHKDGEVDTSDEAKQAVRNDIILQYEAAHWAEKFNQAHPPKRIVFIRAYAIEFPDRPGKPLFAVERFIAGNDSYGVGFVKHNTNSGFVDVDLHRITPQVLSAHSFHASRGTRLVADVQGVGDLYTDPQVLSIDYRFGDGDLGPRGMALFFHSFRHCHFSDAMGIPIFPLSRNELKHQAKYEEDEITVSDEESAYSDDRKLCKFARLDLNRQSRRHLLSTPPTGLLLGDALETAPTMKRSNVMNSRSEVSDSLQKAMMSSPARRKQAPMSRSKSDVDEVSVCLLQATTDTVFDHHAFHRLESGEVRERKRRPSEDETKGHKRRGGGSIMMTAAPPIMPTEETKENLGKVHFHLACLHGLGRFPEDVPTDSIDEDSTADEPHDVFSVLFHLCHAASLYNVPACLSIARVKAGLGTSVSEILSTVVPVDFEGAKDLLRRAMESPQSPAEPKVSAGALLFQILHDEGTASPVTMMSVLEDTLALKAVADQEAEDIARHREREARGGGIHVGDKVEANYFLEGTYYPGVVVEVSSDSKAISVKYDDDDSVEILPLEHVRQLVPPNVNPSDSACTLSDAEALGGENLDEKCILEAYVMKVELAELKAAAGDTSRAAELFQEAADGAMDDGKMQSATKWSLRASELL